VDGQRVQRAIERASECDATGRQSDWCIAAEIPRITRSIACRHVEFVFRPEEMAKIEGRRDPKAAAKGGKRYSASLRTNNALIVSVKDNTVVTVMDKAGSKRQRLHQHRFDGHDLGFLKTGWSSLRGPFMQQHALPGWGAWQRHGGLTWEFFLLYIPVYPV